MRGGFNRLVVDEVARVFGENEEKERRHEVNLEGVGKAREEIEGDEICGDEGEEKRESGVRPKDALAELERGVGFGGKGGRFSGSGGRFGGRGVRLIAGAAAVEETAREEGGEEGEAKTEEDEKDADQAELEEEAEEFVLDDGIGEGELVIGESAT